MMLAFIQMISAALAGDIHSGIPVHQPDLGEPAFQSAANGWTAPLANGQGFVRVFVGRDEAQAADWFIRTREAFTLRLPDYPILNVGTGVDEAAGDGVGALLLRDGNVGVMVRAEDETALAIAVSLQARIVDGVLGLSMPTMQRVEDGWSLVAPGAVYTQPHGGGNIPLTLVGRGSPLSWVVRPESITVWDAYGRATIVR
ncbi:MAG: hypothetical protein EXR69_06625 [Myxococcales bacterium]|nr:hypothetical protein [Myxococcales bacterium]